MDDVMDSVVEFSVCGVGGEFRVSVPKSGRVGDIVEAVYKQIWKDLSDEEFEERWTSTCMILMCTGSSEFMRGDIPIRELLAEDCEAKATDFIGTWLGRGTALKVSAHANGGLLLEERKQTLAAAGLLSPHGDWFEATLKWDDGKECRRVLLGLQDDHVLCCSKHTGEEWEDLGAFTRQHKSGFLGTWSYNADGDVKSYTILISDSADLWFQEGNTKGPIFVEGDRLVSKLVKDGHHHGFIQLRLEDDRLISNFKVQEEDMWQADIVATKHEVFCPADFGVVDTAFPACEFAKAAAVRAHRRALKENAQDKKFALTFILRQATAANMESRRRLSRIRQSRLPCNSHFLKKRRDLSNLPFERHLVTKVAHRLKQLERGHAGPIVHGDHEVTYRKDALEWTEQDWRWSLLYRKGNFIWQHERRGTGSRASRREDIFKSDEQFVDFWTQLSEQSACVYSGLLLYKDEKDIVQLSGTPCVSDFLKFVAK